MKGAEKGFLCPVAPQKPEGTIWMKPFMESPGQDHTGEDLPLFSQKHPEAWSYLGSILPPVASDGCSPLAEPLSPAPDPTPTPDPVLLLSSIVGLFPDPRLTDDFCNRHANLGLLQDPHDLLNAVPLPLHLPTPPPSQPWSWPKTNIATGLVSPGPITRAIVELAG